MFALCFVSIIIRCFHAQEMHLESLLHVSLSVSVSGARRSSACESASRSSTSANSSIAERNRFGKFVEFLEMEACQFLRTSPFLVILLFFQMSSQKCMPLLWCGTSLMWLVSFLCYYPCYVALCGLCAPPDPWWACTCTCERVNGICPLPFLSLRRVLRGRPGWDVRSLPIWKIIGLMAI
jgi:hypothetical protein